DRGCKRSSRAAAPRERARGGGARRGAGLRRLRSRPQLRWLRGVRCAARRDAGGGAVPGRRGVTSPALFPLFLRLTGRPVLVIGAGPLGTQKIRELLAAEAQVTVIAPHA